MVACIRTLKVALLTYICPPLKAAPLEPLKAALFFAEASHRIAMLLKFRPAKGCASETAKGCAFLQKPRTESLVSLNFDPLKAAALKAYAFALTLGILKAALPPPLKAAPRAPARCPAGPTMFSLSSSYRPAENSQCSTSASGASARPLATG